MNYVMTIHATSDPGQLSTYVHTNVETVEAQGDGLVHTTILAERRELVWDVGQDTSVLVSVRKAAEAFCLAAGLSDPF